MDAVAVAVVVAGAIVACCCFCCSLHVGLDGVFLLLFSLPLLLLAFVFSCCLPLVLVWCLSLVARCCLLFFCWWWVVVVVYGSLSLFDVVC